MIHISFLVDSLGIETVPSEDEQLANNEGADDGLRWDEYGNPYIVDITFISVMPQAIRS